MLSAAQRREWPGQTCFRVLHAVGAMDPGGVETWLLNVLRNIDRERFQFDFCTFGPHAGLYAADIQRAGGRILRCPKGDNFWSLGQRFRRILREGKYDIVHSHVHFFSGALLKWAKAEGVPVRIAHSHNSRDGRASTPERLCYRRLMRHWIRRFATHGLAASQTTARELYGRNWQADGRFRVLHYGINSQIFREPVNRAEVRRELNIPCNALAVGHVGRFVPEKNHRFLLQIIEKVLAARPETHFVFVGDGPLRSKIEAQATGPEIVRKLHFLGCRRDVPRLMRGAMDVFVFPSVSEGLPIALLEAQAAGLRCLVSDAVSDEVACVPGALEFRSLSTGAADWAAHLLRLTDTPRVAPDVVPPEVSAGQFGIRQSASSLAELYNRELP
jgi:glycosyltransferase involved in cell wall biosynthesis